jgi:hypothetical protein
MITKFPGPRRLRKGEPVGLFYVYFSTTGTAGADPYDKRK